MDSLTTFQLQSRNFDTGSVINFGLSLPTTQHDYYWVPGQNEAGNVYRILYNDGSNKWLDCTEALPPPPDPTILQSQQIFASQVGFVVCLFIAYGIIKLLKYRKPA